MASKFVRKIIKADPRKLNINMTERGDLVHSDQNEIWGHTGNHYEKLSGAVTKIDIESSTTAPHDVTINFENENSTSEGTSQVGKIVLAGNGFSNDKGIIRNGAVTDIKTIEVTEDNNGGLYFGNKSGVGGANVEMHILEFDKNDFTITKDETKPITTIKIIPKASGGALTPFHIIAKTKGGDAMNVLDIQGHAIVTESGEATKTLTLDPATLAVQSLATADYAIDSGAPLGLEIVAIGDYDLTTISDIDMFALGTHIDLNEASPKTFIPVYFNLQYMNNAGQINDNLYLHPDVPITLQAGKQGQTVIRK